MGMGFWHLRPAQSFGAAGVKVVFSSSLFDCPPPFALHSHVRNIESIILFLSSAGQLNGWTLVICKNGEKIKHFFDKGVPTGGQVF